jgi:NDP-sugar pyrophosphorylase family protein
MIVTESKKETKLYLLVGGKGTRLASVTDGLPKPLVEVNGKPFLNHIIKNLSGFDITLVCSDLNYEYFKYYKMLGVDVYNEGEPSGTAGFLCKMDLPESFYVMNGDTYYSGDFNLDTSKSTIFVNLEKIKGDEGYIIGGNDGRVEAYIEKCPHSIGETHFVNLGIYKLYKKDITLPMRLPLSMEYDILPHMDLSYKIVQTNRFDIGTPERLNRFKTWIPST